MKLLRIRYFVYASLLLCAVSLVSWLVPQLLNPVPPSGAQRREDEQWVSSSPYWLDRQACRWLSLCGLLHLRRDPPALGASSFKDPIHPHGYHELRRRRFSSEPSADEYRFTHLHEPTTPKPKPVPDYVIRHAPLVHLYSNEHFWPSDFVEHLKHLEPISGSNGSRIEENVSLPLSADTLDELNAHPDRVYLQSEDNIESRPDWLHSESGSPVPFPEDEEEDDIVANLEATDNVQWDSYFAGSKSPSPPPLSSKLRPGYSEAPATLIVVDKGNGVVDAFWFFFYSYNLGQTVLGIRFGNHVGDWEHTMIRFVHGRPANVFFSEHVGGQSYTWDAVEKKGDRPVLYSAVGSHAMYPLPGKHSYILPMNLLKDITDAGPLWDAGLNYRSYHYTYDFNFHHDHPGSDGLPAHQTLVPTLENPKAPTPWFFFRGSWGDKLYSLADSRQWRFFGQYHYIDGPDGPMFKSLDRDGVCMMDSCAIHDSIEPGRTWYGMRRRR